MTTRGIAVVLSALLLFISVGCGIGGGGGDDPQSLPIPSSAFRLYGVNMGLAQGDENPDWGWQPTDDRIRLKVSQIAPHTRGVKFFSAAHGAENAAAIAHQEFGLSVVQTAWIGISTVENDKEIQGLINAINAGHVAIGVVGSEAILRGDVSVAQLIAYMDQVRSATAASGVPICTADVYSVFIANPTLISASDILMANFYPFWEGVSINAAINSLENSYEALVAASAGKPVYISETGWSSSGQAANGSSTPSPASAGQYFAEFVAWASERSVPYWYFESHDESWKALGNEGSLGSHWGLLNEAGGLKPEMEEGFSQVLQLTYIPPIGSDANLRGRVWYLNSSEYQIVVYIQVGGWWIKPYAARPTTSLESDGDFGVDITTGGNDSAATRIAVYVIPVGYAPPIVLGGSLPSDLDLNSLASVFVTR